MTLMIAQGLEISWIIPDHGLRNKLFLR